MKAEKGAWRKQPFTKEDALFGKGGKVLKALVPVVITKDRNTFVKSTVWEARMVPDRDVGHILFKEGDI